MADGMSFDKYIDNPSGGSVFTNRNMYKRMYKEKFDAVLVREQGQIKYTIYKTEDAFDTYFIHFKIPSEVIDNFYYDVVIKLYTTDNIKKNDANLRNYAVAFFSNDPAFVYTFAHSFAANNLFIDELKTKMMKRALTDKAEVKNPKDDVWYVKSLFFAYLAMEKYGLFNRSMLNQRSKKYKKSDLLKDITPADIKVKDRQHEQELLDERIRKEKEAARRARQKQVNQQHASAISKTSPITKTAKVSNTTKTTKTSKSTKIIGKGSS